MIASSAAPVQVDIAALIDNSRVGPLQIRMFVLCALCLIIDGFDVQSMGYVAPAVLPDLGMPRAAMANILAAANVGLLVGSLLFTAAADKLGRRPVLIGSTLFFGLMTLLTARATSAEQLMALRFIAVRSAHVSAPVTDVDAACRDKRRDESPNS